MITILVCGSREWTDREAIYQKLSAWYGRNVHVIHGAYRGADTIAGECAEKLGYMVTPFPAAWDEHGKSAGHIRNNEMIKQHPDLVLAFGNGPGTSGMVKLAEQHEVPVERIGYVEADDDQLGFDL